ncbi:MAG: Ig-like domain-containing protein [Cyclobacteriaceae bacterium]|nr:Ig-like domain-containing protein [Cyclobacteriaceae bacterium]
MKRLLYLLILALSSCVGTDFVDINSENIELINPIQSLAKGENYLFETKYTNILGGEENVKVYWESTDPDIAYIDGNGVVSGIDFGEVTVAYTVKNVQGAITFVVAQETIQDVQKTATFQGKGKYNAQGTALLYKNIENELILQLLNDFDTDFALGTFVFLSNSTDGQIVKASGLNLGEITSGGAKSFNITSADAGVGIDRYQYVVILCQPAGITFGFGKFN